VRRVRDPALRVGKTKVEDSGVPPQSTHVRRLVYDASGKLIHDNTWYSSYRGEARVIRVGTKPKPKPKAKAGAKETKPGAKAGAKKGPVTEPAPAEPKPLPQ
jgi:uncharacterized protein YabE (DUF348 family)